MFRISLLLSVFALSVSPAFSAPSATSATSATSAAPARTATPVPGMLSI